MQPLPLEGACSVVTLLATTSQALNRYSLHNHSGLELNGGARPMVLSLATSQKSCSNSAHTASASRVPGTGSVCYAEMNNKGYPLENIAGSQALFLVLYVSAL